eukprot:UN33232
MNQRAMTTINRQKRKKNRTKKGSHQSKKMFHNPLIFIQIDFRDFLVMMFKNQVKWIDLTEVVAGRVKQILVVKRAAIMKMLPMTDTDVEGTEIEGEETVEIIESVTIVEDEIEDR